MFPSAPKKVHPCNSVTNVPPLREAAVPPRISPKGQAFGSGKEGKGGEGSERIPREQTEGSTAALTFLRPTFLGHFGYLYRFLIL